MFGLEVAVTFLYTHTLFTHDPAHPCIALTRHLQFFASCVQDTDESGNRGGEVEVPLDWVAMGEVPAGQRDSLNNEVYFSTSAMNLTWLYSVL